MTRKTIILHILAMEKTQPAYAKWALGNYDDMLPWMDIRAAYDYIKLKGKSC